MPVFVNKIEISDDEVHHEMQFHPAPTVEDARKDASRALIIRHLLLEAAVDHKLLKFSDIKNIDIVKEEHIIEQLLSKIIQVPKADEKTCRRYYERNLNRFFDKTTQKTLPFNMVHNHIKNYLDDKGHQAAFNAYIDRLMDKANIIGL